MGKKVRGRNVITYEYRGQQMSIREVAMASRTPLRMLRERLSRGWTVDAATSTGKRGGGISDAMMSEASDMTRMVPGDDDPLTLREALIYLLDQDGMAPDEITRLLFVALPWVDDDAAKSWVTQGAHMSRFEVGERVGYSKAYIQSVEESALRKLLHGQQAATFRRQART